MSGPIAGLAPMHDRIGFYSIDHGERGDLDPEHPAACLCGWSDYLFCPGAFGPASLFGAVIVEHDGRVDLLPDPSIR